MPAYSFEKQENNLQAGSSNKDYSYPYTVCQAVLDVRDTEINMIDTLPAFIELIVLQGRHII